MNTKKLKSLPFSTVEFQGVEYKTWTISCKHGVFTVGESALNSALMRDGNWVSDEARAIDEGIAYFASEDASVADVIAEYFDL